MIEMKCCGVNDYNDFSKSDSWNLNRGNKTVPEACCHQSIRDGESRPTDDTCTTSPSEANSFYKKVSMWNGGNDCISDGPMTSVLLEGVEEEGMPKSKNILELI